MSTSKEISKSLGRSAPVTPTGVKNVDFVRSGENLHVGVMSLLGYQRRISNFVVADASHLPFKDGAFSLVFSSQVIEHVPDPKKMFAELCRVSKEKVLIRCPHKRGSGAKRPHHLTYIDEAWFRDAAQSIGVAHCERITAVDFPISNRLPHKIG